MQGCKINLVKVDCRPLEYVKDLCLASVANQFNLSQVRRCIYANDFTIRYTSSLFLQLFIFRNFLNILDQLPAIIEVVRQNFNTFKRTKVSRFQTVTINNIQASGCLKQCDLTRFHTDNIPDDFKLFATSDAQDYLPVPFVGKLPETAQIAVLSFAKGNIVRLSIKTSKYSVVCDSVDNFIRLIQVWTFLVE